MNIDLLTVNMRPDEPPRPGARESGRLTLSLTAEQRTRLESIAAPGMVPSGHLFCAGMQDENMQRRRFGIDPIRRGNAADIERRA